MANTVPNAYSGVALVALVDNYAGTGADTFSAGGLEIPESQYYSQFGTVTLTANCCNLPTNPKLLSQYRVTNNGVHQLFVMPGAATNFHTRFGAGVPVGVPPNKSAVFVCTSATKAGVLTWMETALTEINNPEPISAAITLGRSNSGAIYALDTAAGYTITLPPVASCAGAEFIFIVSVKGGSVVIRSQSAVIQGTILQGPVAGPKMLSMVNKTTITSAPACEVGARVMEQIGSLTALVPFF